ncbi:large ribosomal subunit protein mL51 isoform X1 [Bemisia tabaci]
MEEKRTRMSWFPSLAKKIFNPQLTFVRNRYWKDRQGAGHLLKRHGYEETIHKEGLLPRPEPGDTQRLKTLPIYRPNDTWAEHKALFGQNDYIDILGNERVKPHKILYNIPMWLRGVRGNEYQVILRKYKTLAPGIYPVARPTKWHQLRFRIKYLSFFLNRKTKWPLRPGIKR